MLSIQKFAYIFWISLASTLLLYILRGLGIFTFFPGWILLLSILLSIASGLGYGILITKR
jgi:hypothetical protein